MADEIQVIDEAQLRSEYFVLALVMGLDDNGVDRESLAKILKEARQALSDAQYSALQLDIRRYILGRSS